MRPITMMQAQWKADTKEGESLHFENCKGGYFSADKKYGLKVAGRTSGDSCVKAGTGIRVCGKNLFNADEFITEYNINAGKEVAKHVNYEGKECVYYVGSNWTMKFMQGQFKKNTQYTIRFRAFPEFFTNRNSEVLCIRFTDGTSKSITATTNKWSDVTVTSDLGKTIDCITVRNFATTLYVYAVDMQLEEGVAATEYEPYNGNETVTPCDLYEGDIWCPVTGEVKRQGGSTEQYDPQPVFAPKGTVNIFQQPSDLKADLAVTHLVRR